VASSLESAAHVVRSSSGNAKRRATKNPKKTQTRGKTANETVCGSKLGNVASRIRIARTAKMTRKMFMGYDREYRRMSVGAVKSLFQPH
jgi:hypothetical protein